MPEIEYVMPKVTQEEPTKVDDTKENKQPPKETQESQAEIKGKNDSPKVSSGVGPYLHPHRYAPFPSRLDKNNDKTQRQFSKFLEVLKQLHVNLPLTDIITQMPLLEV